MLFLISENLKIKTSWIMKRFRTDCLLFSVPCGLQGVSVHIINQEPVYVIPGSKLSLRARTVLSPEENISSVTWGRRDETGWDPQEVTLATCPDRNIKCLNSKPNVHASFQEVDSTLQVDSFTNDYSGVYAVTVTDHKGAKTTGYCIVRMYGNYGMVHIGFQHVWTSLVTSWNCSKQYFKTKLHSVPKFCF